MLAHNHGGRAIDAALRSLLLLGAVMFYGIGKLLTIADAKYQAQCVQERKAAA